jgi:hypothetical protein
MTQPTTKPTDPKNPGTPSQMPAPNLTPGQKLDALLLEVQNVLREDKREDLQQAVSQARQKLIECGATQPQPKPADEGKAPADHPGAQGLEDGTPADARGNRSAGDKDKARK